MALNGQQYTATSVSYSYLVVMGQISPEMGIYEGDTELTITGRGFRNTGDRCAAWKSGAAEQCATGGEGRCCRGNRERASEGRCCCRGEIDRASEGRARWDLDSTPGPILCQSSAARD